MRIKGIVYDTGFLNAGVTTKDTFDTNLIKREMHIIKNDLHCNAVRITGGDAVRLETVAALAASAAAASSAAPRCRAGSTAPERGADFPAPAPRRAGATAVRPVGAAATCRLMAPSWPSPRRAAGRFRPAAERRSRAGSC